jgi:Icc-related predicted phosphoesterase
MTDGHRAEQTIRIAAAGDVHCRESAREEALAAFDALRGQADLVLLAGDLTTHGEPFQAAVLAEACATLDMPVLAVLGNHDWHANRAEEVTGILREAGITVLDRSWTTCQAAGCDVGVVGLKGFVGGFAGSHLPDFGEPLLREVYRCTSEDVEALDAGLRAIALCPIRIVLLHYAPTAETLEGEPPGIWAFLGTDRLAAPIAEHEPDLVVHGHAHAGRFRGTIGSVPVYNVSVPVMERDFWVFELTVPKRAAAPIH